MSYYKDRFTDHPIHETLEQCLAEMESHGLEDLTEEEVIAISRSEHVVRFAQTMLKRCDSDLTTPVTLEELQKMAAQVQAHWSTFVANRDWNALTSPCDNLIASVGKLSSKQRPIPKSYEQVLGSLRENTAQMLGEMRSAVQEQKNSLGEINTELEELDKRLEAQKEQQQGQQEQLNVLVEQQKGRIDSLITQHQEAFSTSQETRNAEFSEHVSEFARTFEESQAEQESKFNVLRTQQDQSGKQQIAILQEHCDHAKEIVGIIGNIGVTGNYTKIARREWWTALVWQILALVFFGSAVYGGLSILKLSGTEAGFTWEVAIFRILLAIACAGPGVFCALEAGKHRRSEQENRRIALELASLSPYLEKLQDEAKSQEILEKLAPQYFGSHHQSDSSSHLVNVDPEAVKTALGPLIDLIKLVK